jgi:hypothetical protein
MAELQLADVASKRLTASVGRQGQHLKAAAAHVQSELERLQLLQSAQDVPSPVAERLRQRSVALEAVLDYLSAGSPVTQPAPAPQVGASTLGDGAIKLSLSGALTPRVGIRRRPGTTHPPMLAPLSTQGGCV